MPTVKDIAAIVHRFAPPALAYEWDNPGLQVGDWSQEVTKILVALDVTPSALDYALEIGANMIISHHPLIFRKIRNITDPFLLDLIRNNIAVLSAHTNLDVTIDGVNHELAKTLGIGNLKYISNESGAGYFHIAVYVPEDNLELLAEAVYKTGAGRIGEYRDCGTQHPVKGRFEPLTGANPTIGEIGRKETVREMKFEFFADSTNLNAAISAMKSVHPYEEPIFAIYPQHQSSPNYGLGLIGTLDSPMSLSDFAQYVKGCLHAPFVRLWDAGKSHQTPISKVALCGGSGSSLLGKASGKADVFISGDFTYHTLLDSRMPIIDAGHFYTEFPSLQIIKKILTHCEVDIEILALENHEGSRLLSV